MFDLMKLAASSDGRKLVDQIKKIVETEGESADKVIRDVTAMMSRLETIAKRKGVPISRAAKDALDMYEKAP